MPLPAPVKTGSDAPAVPLLAINSTRFTLWSSHFSRLKRLIRAANGSLVTLIGAGHETFSDFPLLYAATAPASGLMGVIDGLVWAFLRGELRESEKVKGREVDGGVLRTTTEGKGKDAGKERLVGEWGDVVVHELGRD
jgi:platelet-activating factor acetylhydrolase